MGIGVDAVPVSVPTLRKNLPDVSAAPPPEATEREATAPLSRDSSVTVREGAVGVVGAAPDAIALAAKEIGAAKGVNVVKETPAIKGNLLEFMKDYKTMSADGSLSKADVGVLEARIAGMSSPDNKAWAKGALADIVKNSTVGPAGELVPKDPLVKNMIDPARYQEVGKRLVEARSHPILKEIKDPETRAQMQEFLKRYTADPLFMSVNASRTINYGMANNAIQTVGSIGTGRGLSDGSVNKLFGSCTECQQRTHEVFSRFKAEWQARPENAGKEFKLEAGNVRTQSAMQHNFTFVKTKGGEEYYVDPWGKQDTTAETVQTKAAWMTQFNGGAFGTGFGAPNYTWVTENGETVHSPGDSDLGKLYRGGEGL